MLPRLVNFTINQISIAYGPCKYIVSGLFDFMVFHSHLCERNSSSSRILSQGMESFLVAGLLLPHVEGTISYSLHMSEHLRKVLQFSHWAHPSMLIKTSNRVGIQCFIGQYMSQAAVVVPTMCGATFACSHIIFAYCRESKVDCVAMQTLIITTLQRFCSGLPQWLGQWQLGQSQPGERQLGQR
jgi:hypothetical protein